MVIIDRQPTYLLTVDQTSLRDEGDGSVVSGLIATFYATPHDFGNGKSISMLTGRVQIHCRRVPVEVKMPVTVYGIVKTGEIIQEQATPIPQFEQVDETSAVYAMANFACTTIHPGIAKQEKL